MIDHRLIEVVRRLLDEAYDTDRGALALRIMDWARIQLRHDPRCFRTGGVEDAYGVGSLVGSELVQPSRDSKGRHTVAPLHAMLLYRTAHLGAPRIHKRIRDTDEAALFAASRDFLLSLGDGDLWVALRGGTRTQIKQLAYRSLSDISWMRTKNNLRNLVLRTPELTLVSAGRRRYVAHSKFFGGAPQVDGDKMGRFPGRVLSVDVLDRLMSQSALRRDAFAMSLAFWLNEKEPVLISLDALATSRLLFLKSLAQEEAGWAGPRCVVQAAMWRDKPLALMLLYVQELIQTEVTAVLATYRPRRPKKTAERVDVWRAAAIDRLEECFGIDFLDNMPRDWKANLDGGLDRLGVRRDRAAHQRVVTHVYNEARKRLRERLRR